MIDSVDRRELGFVVRIWLEPSIVARGQWRGSIEHIATGQRLYFSTLGDLSDFIALRMNQPDAVGDRSPSS